MFKSVKYSAIYAAQYLGMMAVFASIIVLYCLIASPSAHVVGILTSSFGSFVALLALAEVLTVYTYYGNIAISMGATRTQFFLAQQVTQTGYALATVALCAICGYLFHYTIGTELLVTDVANAMLLFATTLLTCKAGELLGLISVRYGKVGMWIYMGVCMLFGGFVGVSFSMGPKMLVWLAPIINAVQSNSFIIVGAAILAAALMTALSYKLSRRLIVR